MNFSALIQGFCSYLEDLSQITNKEYKTESKNASIFMYSSEFKQYLEKELGSKVNIESMSVSDILAMELKEETGDDTYSAENGEAGVDDIINDLFKDKKVQKTVDTDGDGVLSDDEKLAFLNAIKDIDKEGENISLEDVMSAAESIKDGTFETTSTEGTEQPQETTTDEEKPEDAKTKDSGSTHSSGGTDSGSTYTGNDTDAAGDKSDASGDVTQKDVKNMTLDELNTYKTEAQQQVSDIQNTIKDKQTDIDKAKEAAETSKTEDQKAVDEAEEAYNTAEEEYKTAISEDSYLNSDEGKQLKADIEKNLEDIDNAETAQKDTMAALTEANDRKTQATDKVNECTNNVTSAQSAVTEAQSRVDSLESALASYGNVSDDPDAKAKKAEIEEKLRAARANLETKKKELTDAEKALKDAEEELTAAEKAVEEAQAAYDEATEQLNAANETKAELDAQLRENCSEATITAMEKYNEAKTTLDTAKTTQKTNIDNNQKAIDTAQKAMTDEVDKLSKAQAEVDKVNAEITAKEIDKEYSANTPEKLYESLGLKEQGLDYDVFAAAMEGYENLEDKGNGRLAIFDATGKQKCYIVDMVNKKFLYSTDVRLGSNGMGSSIQGANKDGSHATLSGYMKVGSPYQASGHFWQEGIRLIGLENGINNNALSKGVVIHYVKAGQNTTWGCMGIPPVTSNGKVDHAASKQRNREYFPEGTIVYTYPGDNRLDEYKKLSALYA